MYALGRIFGAVFDGYLAAFGWLSPAWSLALLSMLLGVLMLYAFKWVGNPSALERSQARMQAHLMEMRLFDNEPRVVLRSMGRLLWWNLRFFLASLRPAVLATLPMVLLFVQMEHYYGVRAIEPGETVIVTAELVGGDPTLREAITLTPTRGRARVTSSPVRARTPGPLDKVSWQVRGLEQGEELLVLRVGERTYGKSLTISTAPAKVSMRRVSSPYESLLYPIEPPLPGGVARGLEVAYPRVDVALLGFELHWLIWLVLISVFGAFLLKWIVERFLPGALSPRGGAPRRVIGWRARALQLARETVFVAVAGVTVLLLWLMLRPDPAQELARVITPTPPVQPVWRAHKMSQAPDDEEAPDENGEEPGAGEPAARDWPDVILITVDTLRSDRVSVYSTAHVRTPNFDLIAQEGTRFEWSTTAFPKTTPAMASLMTGLWPHHHGSRDVWEPVKDGTFLAEVLQARGYQTLGVSSNSACGSRQGFHKGFDRLINRDRLKRPDADVVTDRAIQLLRRARKEQPLFLWVHYVDPHWPYGPPRVAAETAVRAPRCRQLLQQKRAGGIEFGQVVGNDENMARAAYPDCAALYDASVQFNDAELGRLIEALIERERWEDSLVVFTSDHGESLGEDEYYYSHGASVDDASMRVPLLIRGPGVPVRHVDHGLVQSDDVMPTILRLVGVPEEEWPEMDGNDVSWRWNDKTPRPIAPEEYAIAESSTLMINGVHDFLASGRKGKRYCVHETRYSICVGEPEDGGELAEPAGKPGAAKKPKKPKKTRPKQPVPLERPEPITTFHDHTVDPLQQRPLAPEEVPPEVERRLREGLKRWPFGSVRRRMVRTERYKLVEIPQLSGGYKRVLYDLEADPSELEDISAARPRVARRLSRLLERWLADQPIYESKELTPEEIRELKALGYIGD